MKLKYGIIAGTRSGSTYLCELLQSTNRAGYPDEYLNPDNEYFFKKLFKYQNDRTLINHIIGKAQTSNEVFGGKFLVNINDKSRDQLHQLVYHGYNDLSDWKWIWLDRNNKRLQAISRYKAFNDNIWKLKEKIEIPRIEYSFSGIEKHYIDIQKEDKYIENFLKGKDFIKISYEQDLLEYPEQTITSILDFLDVGVDEIPELKSSSLIKANKQSLEWEQKFKNEQK